MTEQLRQNWIWQKWSHFWFEPVPVSILAVYRILLGLLLLNLALFQLAPEFLLYYGKHAIVPVEVVSTFSWGSQPVVDFMLLLPNNDNWRIAFFVIFVIATIAMTVGFYTRISTGLVFLALLSMHSQFPWIDNGGDTILRAQLLILFFSPAGQAFSYDQPRKSKHTELLYPPFAQRMLQVQLSACYAQAFFSKLHGSHWIDGTALYYCLRLADFFRLPLLPIFDSLIACKLLTWLTLLCELSMFSLVWWRRTRYFALFLGLLLHLGIDWLMNLGLFEWIFICTYVAFLKPQELNLIINMIKTWVAQVCKSVSKKANVATEVMN